MQDRAASGQAGRPLHCSRVSHPHPVLPGRALRGLFAALLLPGLLLAAAPGDARAQDAQAEGWSYEMWNELMSPYCPGRTLADCPSEPADELRIWIVNQERAGRDPQAVEAQLYEQFGDILRSAPRPSGVGITAYLIPLLAFLGGGALVAVFLRRQSDRQAVASAPAIARGPAPDAESLRRVDEQLSDERDRPEGP